MIEINFNDFIKITNMSIETYKNTSISRKIKSLEKSGYKVIGINGRGEKALYLCEELIGISLNNKLKIRVSHAEIMSIYLDMLCGEYSEDILFKSDREVASIILENNPKIQSMYKPNTLKRYICECRNQLVQIGWLTNIPKTKEQKLNSDKVYKIVNLEKGINDEITKEEFVEAYRDYYFKYIKDSLKLLDNIDENVIVGKSQLSIIAQKARKNMIDVLGGNPVVIYKKDFKLGGFDD